MKKFIFCMMALLMLPLVLCAQTADPVTDSEVVVNFGTFTGIVTVISTIVTQIAKLAPAINNSKIAKIGTSIGVGVLVCLFAWGLHFTSLMDGFPFWEVLIYGVAAGMSGCGFYDLIKVIGNLFKSNN